MLCCRPGLRRAPPGGCVDDGTHPRRLPSLSEGWQWRTLDGTLIIHYPIAVGSLRSRGSGFCRTVRLLANLLAPIGQGIGRGLRSGQLWKTSTLQTPEWMRGDSVHSGTDVWAALVRAVLKVRNTVLSMQ
ncbi:hypothetical protein DPEC_G00346170 [Dallia pectoralis]|uniref:Uncharacterized protein n=1 Tax=Dallia pectoralis TaxID=75939 RepID=A0ACC2F3W3_DALPE|nr:hypothetical protein DPEC_G00346170 [Dallia pectoralis]